MRSAAVMMLLLPIAAAASAKDPEPVVPVAPVAAILPKATIDREAAEQGKLLYGIYCTSCHGEQGRGDGPSAGSLQPRPANLTGLSRDNDDRFPTARVIMSIDGRNRIPGHDEGRMPIWGASFQESASDANQEDQVRKKILHLVEFLKTLQLPGND